MSPFKQNLERFLVFFFTATSIILVIMGVVRSKSGALSALPTPGQKNPPVTSEVSAPATKGSSTFTGKTYQTPWGNAVASISVTNGKITGVSMPQVPDSPPSVYAKPYLVQQALTAGSANIQGVSGATYTSLAFKSSLESALAQAKAQGQTITGAAKTGTATVAPKPTIPRKYRDDEGGEVEFDKWFQ